MLLTILLLLVVLLVIGLLFVPIQIYMNTDTGEYFLRLKGLAKASLEYDEKEVLRIRMRTLLFQHSFYPLRPRTKKKRKTTKPKTKRKRRFSIRKIVRILGTFKVKRFEMDIDTGDYALNAKMYPVFVLLNQFVAPFHINFQDRNFLVIDVRNRAYWIIKSFINN